MPPPPNDSISVPFETDGIHARYLSLLCEVYRDAVLYVFGSLLGGVVTREEASRFLIYHVIDFISEVLEMVAPANHFPGLR